MRSQAEVQWRRNRETLSSFVPARFAPWTPMTAPPTSTRCRSAAVPTWSVVCAVAASRRPTPVTEQRGFEAVRRAFAADPPLVENHVLHRRLGRGGCGMVRLAHHAGLDQWRALKVLRAADRYSPAALEALRREARIMAQLKPHRNRVQVYDLLETAGMPVLVMDYVAGGSLGKLAPLPWEQAVRYVADAAEGWSEVHALGLRHGDSKPSNLLRKEEGEKWPEARKPPFPQVGRVAKAKVPEERPRSAVGQRGAANPDTAARLAATVILQLFIIPGAARRHE
jgi:hypothetical protein